MQSPQLCVLAAQFTALSVAQYQYVTDVPAFGVKRHEATAVTYAKTSLQHQDKHSAFCFLCL